MKLKNKKINLYSKESKTESEAVEAGFKRVTSQIRIASNEQKEHLSNSFSRLVRAGILTNNGDFDRRYFSRANEEDTQRENKVHTR